MVSVWLRDVFIYRKSKFDRIKLCNLDSKVICAFRFPVSSLYSQPSSFGSSDSSFSSDGVHFSIIFERHWSLIFSTCLYHMNFPILSTFDVPATINARLFVPLSNINCYCWDTGVYALRFI